MEIKLTENEKKVLRQLVLAADLVMIENIFINFGPNNINLSVIPFRDKALAEQKVGFISACSPTEVSYYPIFGDSKDEYYPTELKFLMPSGKESKDYNKGNLIIGDYVVQDDEIIDFLVDIILKINPSYYWLLSDKTQKKYENLKPNYKEIYDYRVYHIISREMPTEDEIKAYIEYFNKEAERIFDEKTFNGLAKK